MDNKRYEVSLDRSELFLVMFVLEAEGYNPLIAQPTREKVQKLRRKLEDYYDENVVK